MGGRKEGNSNAEENLQSENVRLGTAEGRKCAEKKRGGTGKDE